MDVLIGLSLAVLAYVYVGYRQVLQLLVRLRGVRPIRRADIRPPLSLVISAYNEAAVIRQKIENALALDYPRDALEIAVVSDASTDGTDAIVAAYADRGVRLIRQPVRRGKTAGLNRAVPMLRGELVVFSDANAIYERDALRALARNFADAEVGCVTGEARYRPRGRAAADLGERVYWAYEIQIKKLETAVGSMVGGDGAIYAIRRSLWQELPENAINDFLNPLQIVAAGWRAVYDPEAVCYEDTVGAVGMEYRRRVRIVSRSWRAVFQARGVLNPLRVGLFAWSLVSHKLLRWIAGWVALPPLIGLGTLGISLFAQSPAAGAAALLGATALVVTTRRGRRVVALLSYFAVINVASMVGVLKGSFGRVSGIWLTARHAESRGTDADRSGALAPAGRALLLAATAASSGAIVALAVKPAAGTAAVLFWTSASLLGYVYVGYPLILLMLKRLAPQPVTRAPIEPAVCLFITAHNESRVIEAKLRNSLALAYPPNRLDIVVASDGSDDQTNAIVRQFAPRVALLEFPTRRGKIAAINDGMRLVASEIVVFSDANTFLERGAIRAIVRNFHDERVGAVSGDVMLSGDRAALARSEDLYYRYERWLQRAESEIGSMIGADGALYAIRRELFVPPASDTILDDMAIPMTVLRARRRVVFEPGARAHEQGSETAREEFARKSRVIAGAIQFMRRRDSALPLRAPQVIFSFISHKGLRWLSPVFATCAVIASVVLAGTSSGYTAAALAQALLYAGGVAGCVPAFRRAGMIAIAHYFCLVQTAAAVGFVRGLAGRQSVLWQRFVHGPVAQDLSQVD